MPSIFEYSIAYVEELQGFEGVAVSARQAGVKGLAIKLVDTGSLSTAGARNRDWLLAKAPVLRAMGFVLGGWHCPRFVPGESALAASSLVKQFGLSFTVFETEWEYKTDGGGVDVASLLKPWRAIRPKQWTGFAVTGTPPDTFNHAACIADPYAVLCPENYWMQHGSYDARASLEHAQALGWSRDRVKPTLTGVEGHSMAESIIRTQRAYGIPFSDEEVQAGVLLWRGDMLSSEDYRLFGLADTLALR